MNRGIAWLLIALAGSVAGALPSAHAEESRAALSTSRAIELNVKPLALAFGVLGAELQVGVASRFAVSGEVDWFNSSGGRFALTQLEYSFYTSYWITGERFGTGWILRPGLHYDNQSIGRPSGFASTSYSTELSVAIDRVWYWRNGASVGVGAGAAVAFNDPVHRVEPVLDWRVGWVF